MSDGLKDVDRNLAFVIELVGGIFGILGIGHMYAGDITGGVIRLIVWLSVIAFSWVLISILLIFFIGLCCIPFMIIAQIGVPIWSAFSLKKKLEEAYPE